MATVLIAATLVGAAGCSSASPPTRLVGTGPAGYQLDTSASQRQLSASSVAQATPADPALTKQALRRNGFTGATSRVWHATTGDFLLDLAVRFRTPAGANAFVSFELDQIGLRVRSSAPTATDREAGIYPYSEIPGAKLFLLAGPNRQTKAPVFIQGVAFASDTTAYLVETGATMPSGVDLVEKYAKLQAGLDGA
jgi:hypothetical protein